MFIVFLSSVKWK